MTMTYRISGVTRSSLNDWYFKIHWLYYIRFPIEYFQVFLAQLMHSVHRNPRPSLILETAPMGKFDKCVDCFTIWTHLLVIKTTWTHKRGKYMWMCKTYQLPSKPHCFFVFKFSPVVLFCTVKWKLWQLKKRLQENVVTNSNVSHH